MSEPLGLALGAVGLIVLFVWGIAPLRLPLSERHLEREHLATLLGLALTVLPAVWNRNNKS